MRYENPEDFVPDDRVLSSLVRGRARVAEGWRQHGYFGDNFRSFCAVGAILDSGKARDIEALLISAMTPEELTRARNHSRWWVGSVLVDFNDAPGTTQADVLAIYDRAIEKREGEVSQKCASFLAV